MPLLGGEASDVRECLLGTMPRLVVACNDGYEWFGATTVLMPGRAENVDVLDRGKTVAHEHLGSVATTHTHGCRWGARLYRLGPWGHRRDHTTRFGRCACSVEAHPAICTESTVKCHLSSAFGKLGVRSRNEAVKLILDPERGLGMGILALGGEPVEATPTTAQ